MALIKNWEMLQRGLCTESEWSGHSLDDLSHFGFSVDKFGKRLSSTLKGL